MRVVVTGADGYIGRHTLAALKAAGIETIGVDPRDERHQASPLADSFVRCEAWQAFQSLEGKIDAVIHLGARCDISESLHDPGAYAHDAQNARTLALNCAVEKVPHVIFASSAAVYGAGGGPAVSRACAPISPYGRHKLGAEQALQEGYPHATILRLFNVAGADPSVPLAPPHGFIRALCDAVRLRLVLPVHRRGTIIRDWVHVSRVTDTILALLQEGWTRPAPINVCTGYGCSLLQVVEEARRLWGARLKPVAYTERAPAGQPNVLVGDRALDPHAHSWRGPSANLRELLESTMTALEAYECLMQMTPTPTR